MAIAPGAGLSAVTVEPVRSGPARRPCWRRARDRPNGPSRTG